MYETIERKCIVMRLLLVCFVLQIMLTFDRVTVRVKEKYCGVFSRPRIVPHNIVGTVRK